MTNQHVNICVGDINIIRLNQWLANKYYFKIQSNTRYFSMLEFPLSYNQVFYVSAIGHDISGDYDGNPTYHAPEHIIICKLTEYLMMYIICI